MLLSGVSRVRTAAAEEDPNVVAAARALAVEGVKLAQDKRCAEAIDKLERAEQLRHSAIVLEQLGECYIEQGRFVEGSEALHAVVREGLPENPSDAYKRANANARALLEPTRAKIAQLTITVEVLENVQPEVLIDGQKVPPALLGAARPTDPGDHTIDASAPGFLPITRHVTLAPGQSQSLDLSLVVDPAQLRAKPALAEVDAEPAPTTQSAAATPAENAASAAADGGMSRLPAYLTWGGAAAALVVGGAFGWVAMNQKSDLESVCPDNQCPPEQTDKLDAARTNATVSTMAFGVGAGLAVLGTVLFFLADDGESQTARLGTDGVNLQLRF
ncbi:MAG TPA: carboxypeptidase-like regulatory domain-containing protein [Polyangiales bacterium]|nr:carboxypeptidase-like regulatory domain-containing protein [Polyangiales bacterium]